MEKLSREEASIISVMVDKLRSIESGHFQVFKVGGEIKRWEVQESGRMPKSYPLDLPEEKEENEVKSIAGANPES